MEPRVTVIARHPAWQPIYRYWTKVRRPVLVFQELQEWINKYTTGQVVIGHTWVFYEYEADAVFHNLTHQGVVA